MTDWGIERLWKLKRSNGEQDITTRGLLSCGACALLGSAGQGKTHELEVLRKSLADRDIPAIEKRFVEIGPDLTAASLRSGLSEILGGLIPGQVLLLDALDEAMVSVRMIATIVSDWIREDLASNRPHLLISCRSAVWPEEISSAMTSVYGRAAGIAVMQPLTLSQQQAALRAEQVANCEAFFEGTAAARVDALCEQPMTLRLLIDEFRRSGIIPNDRCELFGRAVTQLVVEREERYVSGSVPRFSESDLLEASERLACFLLLSDRRAISLGDNPVDGCFSRRELSDLPAANRALDYELLRAVSRTGLFDSDEAKPFSFTHRLFAEYLAGRRLATLPLHQSRVLLGSPLGWKEGVTGPLRETAAIAANLNSDVASWIADTDPEVIGLSDVVNDEVRRTAARSLLQLCRAGKLADTLFMRDGIELLGLQYADAESDLRSALVDRGNTAQDVLECAIRMIREWKLVSMSEDLAILALDDSAPFAARKAAGYVVAELAPQDVRGLLKPLVFSENEEFKGVGLKCNWPDNMSHVELLDVLTTRQNEEFSGSYSGFLWELEDSDFAASECPVTGLQWARDYVGQRSPFEESLNNIAKRIIHSSLDLLDDEAVSDAICDIIQDCISEYRDSPFDPVHLRYSRRRDQAQPHNPLDDTSIRRQLIELIVIRFPDPREYAYVVHSTNSLRNVADFEWLIGCALDESLSEDLRRRFAEFADFLPWMDDRRSVDLWMSCRNKEPVATVLNYPVVTVLDSEEARQQKEFYEMTQGAGHESEPELLAPPPTVRVLRMLSLCETDNPLYFRRLAEALTLKPSSRYFDCIRFLSNSPGWEEASAETRVRIVRASKSYLTCPDNDDPSQIKKCRINSIHIPAIAAIFLVHEFDSKWLSEKDSDWWTRWAWLILRELNLHMMDEPDDIKLLLLKQIHAQAGDRLREDIRRLAVGHYRKQTKAANWLLRETLNALVAVEDHTLDQMLCDRLARGTITKASVREVAQFVLNRSPLQAKASILPVLHTAEDDESDSTTVDLVAALFTECCAENWNDIRTFLERHPQSAVKALAKFVSDRSESVRKSLPQTLAAASPTQVAELLTVLYLHHPPETERSRNSRTQREIQLADFRETLLHMLTYGPDDEKPVRATERIDALRRIEERFSDCYSWLRRPRSRAERDFRLRHRKAIAADVVADILSNAERRLIRHDSDAMDGIVAAIEQLEHAAQRTAPSTLSRYWNNSGGVSPAPKKEEVISDEICLAIRSYFQSFAVVADREVQLFRRAIPKAEGGAPGSEVDVFATVSARGTSGNDVIAIPIEVKRSCDNRAPTAMEDQLVDRYMAESGTSVGMYVLVWFNASNLMPHHRPKWATKDEAIIALNQQAEAFHESHDLKIRVVVIDLALQ